MKDFDSLAREARPGVYRFALSLTKNPLDAEDLTQEAFFRAFRSFGSFRDEKPFVNWVCSIVTRRFLDKHRAESRRVRTVAFEDVVLGLDITFDPTDGTDPSTVMEEGYLSPDFREAIKSLSWPLRRVVKMVYVEGCDQQDVASALNLPFGTIRSRLHRARAQMSAQLSQ